MPIYEYKCASCGMRKDILRKLSDAPLTVCPECGKEGLQKVLTAAGFQLKGTGWYATDFKGGQKPPAESTAGDNTKTDGKSDSKTDSKTVSKTESKTDSKSETKTETKTESKAEPTAPAS
jgi:putative FmdB family regulatory protein